MKIHVAHESNGEKPSADLRRIKRPVDRADRIMKLTLLALVAFTAYAFTTFRLSDFGSNSISLVRIFRVVFFEARLKHITWAEGFYQILITFGLAFLTTLFGSIVALFLSLFAAQNLSNKKVSSAVKGFVALIRAIPTILWVLIFAVAAGLGSAAAIIGMSFHTISYLVKAYSESYEELDPGVIEALRSSGANWWQVVFQAVFPSSITSILSWTFMRFEINFLNAVAMGAAAGAGGIGFALFMAGGHYLDFREVGLITYLILAVAVALEYGSIRMKVRLKTY